MVTVTDEDGERRRRAEVAKLWQTADGRPDAPGLGADSRQLRRYDCDMLRQSWVTNKTTRNQLLHALDRAITGDLGHPLHSVSDSVSV